MSTTITTIIPEPVPCVITEPKYVYSSYQPLKHAFTIPQYSERVTIGEKTAIVSTAAVYRKTRRLRCLPALPKSSRSLSIHRRFWYLYLPITVVILTLVSIFITLSIMIMNEHTDPPSLRSNTTHPSSVQINRTIDSPDGTKPKGSLLNSMEISIRDQCSYLLNATDVSTFYKQQCSMDFCFADPGILTPQVLSICTLGRMYEFMPAISGWMKDSKYCGWDGIICDDIGLIVSIFLNGTVPTSIPDSITNLYNLANLTFIGNAKKVHGYLPSELFQIKTIQSIVLKSVGYQFGFSKVSTSLLSLCLDSLPGWDRLLPEPLRQCELENLSLQNISIGSNIFTFLNSASKMKESLVTLRLSQLNATYKLDPFSFQRLETLDLTGMAGNMSDACMWGKQHQCVSCC
ncbi:hypothetical protein HDV04_000448 [Boothiomyces sp. JEL0838]|nr:hypothetical protein HDV04_000448 [Boothiomyces sp. JEL0838]